MNDKKRFYSRREILQIGNALTGLALATLLSCSVTFNAGACAWADSVERQRPKREVSTEGIEAACTKHLARESPGHHGQRSVEQWSLVSGQRSVVRGQWSVASGYARQSELATDHGPLTLFSLRFVERTRDMYGRSSTRSWVRLFQAPAQLRRL